MFQGKTNVAMQLLSQQGKGGVLNIEDMIDSGDNTMKPVVDKLISKHPPAQPVSTDALIVGDADLPEVPPVVFDQITASSICGASLRTVHVSIANVEECLLLCKDCTFTMEAVC